MAMTMAMATRITVATTGLIPDLPLYIMSIPGVSRIKDFPPRMILSIILG